MTKTQRQCVGFANRRITADLQRNIRWMLQNVTQTVDILAPRFAQRKIRPTAKKRRQASTGIREVLRGRYSPAVIQVAIIQVGNATCFMMLRLVPYASQYSFSNKSTAAYDNAHFAHIGTGFASFIAPRGERGYPAAYFFGVVLEALPKRGRRLSCTCDSFR